MKKLQILAYGKHPDILATVLRLINKNESWYGEGSIEEEEVIRLFEQGQYDLVLLGGGVPKASEDKIRALFTNLNPMVKIIQHYGGGSGLLKSEIETALRAKEV